jgi:uroporphyrin-III C-methyltransferase
MTDPNKDITNATSESETKHHTVLNAKATVVLTLLILVVVVWQWFQTRHSINQIEESLTQKLEQFNEKSLQSLALSKNADDRSASTVARISLLEQQFEKSLDQQQALETLYSELADNREERIISEVEQLLVIANQQLQLAGNIKPALVALQTADSRLQNLDTPQAIQLRKSLSQNIQQLQNLPLVDTVGMSLKLESLSHLIEKLRLISEQRPKPQSPYHPDTSEKNTWQNLVQEIWYDIKHMVEIERVDHPQPPLLTPEQAYFLRENIKLRILTARVALLQHDEVTYKTDLLTTKSWLTSHFDLNDADTRTALSIIKELSNSAINIQMPDIEESLNIASTYKLSLEHKSSNQKHTMDKK